MTIAVMRADLLKEDFGIIVHGVNAQGKMNSGFAKDLREKYPQVYEDYMHEYGIHGSLKVGQAIKTRISSQLEIVSAVTQEFYGRDPNIKYIDYNSIIPIFRRISDYALLTRLPVKFPMIGCGLGGGQWSEVEKRIEHAMASIVPRILFIKD